MNEIRKITSRDNGRLKYARRVREVREKGKIFLEGVRLVEGALRSGIEIESGFVSSDSVERFKSTGLIDRLGDIDVYDLPESIFQSLADTKNAQGVIVIANCPSTGREVVERRLETSAIPVTVLLHQINNPSNLGAVIRTAEAAGAAGVIVSSGSADAFSPKALRAAMSSSLRFPLWTEVDVSEALKWAKDNDLRTVAADVGASSSYSTLDWRIPRMLVLGSEAHGLPEVERKRVDELILIPMEAEVESLNLAVACGVVLFEARKQNATP
jgi:TrmH family RNA methyltransferase